MLARIVRIMGNDILEHGWEHGWEHGLEHGWPGGGLSSETPRQTLSGQRHQNGRGMFHPASKSQSGAGGKCTNTQRRQDAGPDGKME